MGDHYDTIPGLGRAGQSSEDKEKTTLSNQPASDTDAVTMSEPAATPEPEPQPAPGIPALGLRGFARRHWLFALALLAASVPRAVAMLGFQPAILFRMDSYDYLWGASHISPDLVNPSGYSLFLWLLRPLHSLAAVVALQHLMGLGIATMAYAVLRRHGLPAWGATLGAAPALFLPAFMLTETLIMSDLLAMALMVAALGVLLLGSPSLARSAAAGLLMGTSAIVRPTTLPLVIAIPLFLLLRRAGWRRAGTALAAGALPVLGYMGWFAAVHGSVNMSQSNGLFLWSRTMSFADCSVIKPPADLRQLCPTAQHGFLAQADPAKRPPPKWYLWMPGLSWSWWHAAPAGMVPDKVPFTAANNTRALRFAVLAIRAQPLAYTSTVGRETIEPFTSNDATLHFPGSQPPFVMDRPHLSYALAAVQDYTGSAAGLAPLIRDGAHFTAQQNGPYAYLMREYQRLVFLPGFGLGLIALAGLAGIALPRRRSAAAILLWLSAAVIIVLPIAEHEYAYRYALPAVPLLAMAAALAFRRHGSGEPQAADAGEPQPAG